MCPICITTALLITSGVAGTGGLAAVAMRKFGGRLVASGDKQVGPKSKDQIEDSLPDIAPGVSTTGRSRKFRTTGRSREDDDEYEDEKRGRERRAKRDQLTSVKSQLDENNINQ